MLVHNIVATWAFKFNSPLWSVATEWQIYFALPFLLLPVWRRYGVLALGAAGLVVGLLPHFLFHGVYDSAQHWLLGQFAFGCCAAVICTSQRGFDAKLRAMPWGVLTSLTLGLLLIVNWLPRFEKYWQAISILSGVPAACLLIWCWHGAQNASYGKPLPVIVQLCQSPFALWLGKISYSLYLTHILVVMIVSSLCGWTMSSLLRLAIYMTADTLLALGLAAAFHFAVERHFLNAHRAVNGNVSPDKI
jgi:peptidoglycan/LPS O-acetylase OafA/YrhL